MADGNTFNGSFTLTPSIRVKVQASGLGTFGNQPRIVALIGQSTNGQPGVVMQFSAPQQAVAALGGGELLQAIFRAFNPSRGGNGPSTIYAIRCNPASQAKLTINDATAAPSIDLTSADWGANQNLINVTVASGTVNGTKVTVANNTSSFTLDNIARNAFSIQYTGAGTAATMTVTGTTLTTTCTGATADNLNLAFSSYTTIQQLVSFINGTGKYTAAVLSPNPNDATLNNLDFVTAVGIKTSVYTATMNLAAVVMALNANTQPLVTAVRHTGAGQPPSTTGNINQMFLTGGSDNGAANHLDGSANGTQTLTVADWTFCIGLFDTQDIRYLVPITSDPGVQSIALNHAVTTSASGYLPRRCVFGSALGLYTASLGNYLPLASAMNSNRAIFVPQGLQDYDDQSGALTMYPPYIYAAQVAGLIAGQDVGNAITQEFVRGVALEWNPNAAQVNTAIGGGLLISTYNVRALAAQVSRGVTTWLIDNSFNNVEISVADEIDHVVLTVLDYLQPFLGRKASQVVLVQLASQTQSALQAEFVAGILVGDAAPEPNGTFNPPYSNITVSINGDVATVTFTCQPGIPLNFINVTMTLNVFSGTTEVATT